jgi:cystathionine beta-lyase
MDFAAPEAVAEALRERVAHGVFGYGKPRPSLTEAVLEYLAGAHGLQADEDEIVWLPGVVPALNMACRAAGDTGDEILTCTPVYPPFLAAPANADRRLTSVPLALEGGRWGFDFDAMQAAVTPQTRLFILCNPHNPTGYVYRRGELDRLFEFCDRHGLVLCSDEIHCDLVLEPGLRHVSTGAVVDGTPLAARTISLFSPSKTYNIPGLSFAFAHVPDPALRARFRRAGQGFLSEINVLATPAAEAAYRRGEPWRQRLLAYLRGNRDALYAFAAEHLPGVHLTPMEATYLAWMDVRDLGLADPVAHFEAHGVALSDGKFFGLPGFVRFNFGCARHVMIEGLERMRAAVTAATTSGAVRTR